MSNLIAAASLPKTLVARLRELQEQPGMRVNRIPVLTTPVGQPEILDTAGDAVSGLMSAPHGTCRAEPASA